MEFVEAELNALIDAVRESGGSREVERALHEAIESVHYGKVSGEDGLIVLIRNIIGIAKPPVLSRGWEETWGNLFSHLIQIIMNSERGTERVISYLYGCAGLPEQARDERVLCVNPGSTSTKLALFRGLSLESTAEVHIPPDYDDSVENRCEAIIQWVEQRDIASGELTGIACRGGFVLPVPTGTYEVCGDMVEDLSEPRIQHASNMAIPIGLRLKERFGDGGKLLITTTDPVASDEMETGARLTGILRILRDGTGAHYLSHQAVHRLTCAIIGCEPDRFTTISAHLGGGISIIRHMDGIAGDLVNAFAGIPSANRCGTIPLDCLMEAMGRGDLNIHELKKYLYSEGGLINLTGTNDFRALLHFRDTGAVRRQREKIELVIDFFATNIASSVMKLAAVESAIDLVVLTGGLSRSPEFTGRIKHILFPYFPVVVIPGSIEHESMVAGHLRARYIPGEVKDYRIERDRLRRRRMEERELLETEIFPHPHLRRRESAPITSLDELVYVSRSLVAKYRAPRIAIVGAENEDAVVAAKQANEEGRYPVAKFFLVGDYYEVNKLAWEYDITVDGDNYTIVDSDDPVTRAVDLLNAGEADLLMKGRVKTAEIMGGAIRYLKGGGRLKKGRIYSHVGIFHIPTYPKLLMVTDAALIPSPTEEMKGKILENALTVCGYLNIMKPKVAVISAVETMNPSVQSSMLAGEFAARYRDRTDCIVEGPLSLDVAMDPRSAHEKRYGGRIMGNADVLLMPDIEAGNVVYKTLTVSSGAYLAGAIVGAGIPIILTSRGDSARSKLASICLACLIALKQGDLHPAE